MSCRTLVFFWIGSGLIGIWIIGIGPHQAHGLKIKATEVLDTLPAVTWVITRDGRRVAFDADRIRQTLFDACAALGPADAFLAQELTEAVLHFGAAEWRQTTPSTRDIAEVVSKVVRELGHPRLARLLENENASSASPRIASPLEAFSYVRGTPVEITKREFLKNYCLRTIYTHDLAQAFSEGWLILGNLDAPAQAAWGVVEGFPGTLDADDWDAWESACRQIHGHLILDGLEWVEPRPGGSDPLTMALHAARLMDRELVVHANTPTPPPWLGGLPASPLFPDHATVRQRSPGEILDFLKTNRILKSTPMIDWHVNAENIHAEMLEAPIEYLVQGGGVRFTLDRQRAPISLGEGVDRAHPLALVSVGLDLPRFFSLPTIEFQIERFLEKIPALARMAVSVGLQKRKYLRTAGDSRLTKGFRLERARLVIVPIGLDALVRQILGETCVASPRSQDLALRILKSLHEAATLMASKSGLGVAFDRSPDFPEAGLSCPDARFSLEHQLEAVAPWHAQLGGATCVLALAGHSAVSSTEIADTVRMAGKKSTVSRLEFRLLR